MTLDCGQRFKEPEKRGKRQELNKMRNICRVNYYFEF